MSRLLHVGCGVQPVPGYLSMFEEVRLDVSPLAEPDIVASMVDMGDIGTFEIVFSSHCLEHIYPHEVPIALGEFHRVLEPGGKLILYVPDLEDVKATDDILFESPGGSISGMDLIYGYRPFLSTAPHMAHHTGFTRKILTDALEKAGFGQIATIRIVPYNLFACGVKQ